MSFFAPVVGRRLLLPPSALTAEVASQTLHKRCFSTTVSLSKKSNRSRKTQKSPRHQALFIALKPELGARAARIAEQRALKKKQSALDPAEGEVVATFEEACAQLKTHAKKRLTQAVEAHIVTTVGSHETNAFRGRILYPRDPRKTQERILIFAEEGSDASDAVKALLKEELASAPKPKPESEESQTDSSRSKQPEYEPSLIVGGSSMIPDVANRKVSGFTKILCTSNMLPEVTRTFARSWGPKGLMPSVRRGTVVSSDESEAMLAAIAETRGAADWRSDKVGVVRAAIGRLNFDDTDIRKNFTTLLDAIVKKVPTLGTQQSTADGGTGATYVPRPPRELNEVKKVGTIVKSVHLSSSQGPGVKLDLRDALL